MITAGESEWLEDDDPSRFSKAGVASALAFTLLGSRDEGSRFIWCFEVEARFHVIAAPLAEGFC